MFYGLQHMKMNFVIILTQGPYVHLLQKTVLMYNVVRNHKACWFSVFFFLFFFLLLTMFVNHFWEDVTHTAFYFFSAGNTMDCYVWKDCLKWPMNSQKQTLHHLKWYMTLISDMLTGPYIQIYTAIYVRAFIC